VAAVRPQTSLRLSREETALLDAAARRLRLDRAALIRAAALGVADLVCESARPLVIAVEPAALLRRIADRLAPPAARELRRSETAKGERSR
jgi:hypothetical protein